MKSSADSITQYRGIKIQNTILASIFFNIGVKTGKAYASYRAGFTCTHLLITTGFSPPSNLSTVYILYDLLQSVASYYIL